MSEERVARRLAAILAADMVGYSRLMERDEEGTIKRQKAHRAELIDPKFAEHGGRIVKSTGDGLLVEFTSAVDAVRCAIEVQLAMTERESGVPEDQRIVYRVGINLGDIVIDGDDILGDGVNVAARLEGLAEPGGIYISGKVFEEIRGRIDLAFETFGEQRLKNIKRPVPVFRWMPEGPRGSVYVAVAAPLPIPDKPSVAVLPFDNLSGDPDQEYFSDGITEDIITDLSKFGDLFVIARNSSFYYKRKATRMQTIRDELGVRYIVEGSVRKSNSRVRVNVQLIDSESGSHIWAERYDRDLIDLFDVQDELCQTIVARLPGRIGSAETERLKRRLPRDMVAYEYLVAGKIHHHRVTPDDNAQALRLLSKATDIDPTFAEAFAWKACTLGQAIQFGFGGNSEALEREAMEALRHALSLDANNAECHRLLCEIHMELHDLERAQIHGAKAISINPNDPRLVAQQGELLTWLGNAKEGVEWIEKALRLDPHGMTGRVHLLGRALFGAGRYAEAVNAFRQITLPDFRTCAYLAAAFARLGKMDEAWRQAQAILERKPDFQITSFVASLPYTEEDDRKHLATGLHEVSLPQ